MTGLVTLREPVLARPPLPYPEELDPEAAFATACRAGWGDERAAAFAAHALGLPLFDGEGEPIHWTMLEVRQMRFLGWLAGRGDFASGRGARS
jgi:hypothetical protein